jgi:quinol-cytochrome oxidoreductase complex cytochrome b subunit
MVKDKRQTRRRPGVLTSIWRSVFRGPIYPRDDRERKWIVFNHWILHFRPVRVPEKTVRYTHTWGLGGMSLVLFLLLVSTGVLLMFVYEPSPGYAYDSIVNLQNDVFFGKLIRNIHHWSANFLVAMLVLHSLRVYLTGAYYPPRQFNWVIGLSLLGCVLISNFTGYLLPWDQLSYWATTIVTGMLGYVPLIGAWLQGVIRGGSEIGPATLVIFYAAHTTLIPVVIIGLMGLHFWRIRKARGVVVPRSPGEAADKPTEYVLTLPHLLLRELSVALALVAFVMVISLLFDAPLGEAANPGMSPDPAKAPWYFVGIQELLLHFNPLFALVIIPLMIIAGLLLIPYFKYEHDTSGIFMMSHKGRQLGLLASIAAIILTPTLIVADELWIDFGAWLPGMPPEVSNGLLPLGILAAALIGFHLYLKKQHDASNNEAIQTSFVLLLVAFVILTITGAWFRGSGMALVWPWGM